MEVVSCKIDLSHYCIWKEEDSCFIEDVEACRSISISVSQLRWTQSVISDLLRTLVDNYFNKFGDIDRGRLRILKFQAKFGWVLSCDHWPYSGGLFNIRVCSGKDQQRWKSFCKMLEKFVEKMDYVRWYSGNISSFPSSQMVEKSSYADKAKSSSSKLPAPRSEKMEVRQNFSQKRKLQAARHPSPPKQKQWLIKNHEVAKVNFENLWIISKLFAR